MTDIPVDLLPDDLPNGLSGPTPIDVTSIDQRLQTINHVEATWSLPALPDEVKLDLVSAPEAVGLDVADWLYGLATDLTRVEPVRDAVDGFFFGQGTEQALAAAGPGLAFDTPTPPGFRSLTSERFEKVQAGWRTPAVEQGEDAVLNRLRRGFHAVANAGERQDLARPWRFADDPTAPVVDLKKRAIAAGLLPEDTPLTGVWTPALQSIRWQLLQQDANREMAGDRGGAMSIAGVGNLMDRWLSPTGLLASAVALDFVPDFAQAGREASEWGDKWRAWNEDRWNPGKLLDAITGPIDDVALPVINTALLLTGVGSVGLFALRGTQLLRAGTTLGRFASATSLAGRVEALAQPSFMAQKLMQGNRLAGAGEAMAAWRQFSGVQIAKRGIQEGMKLGVAGNLESSLFNTGRDDDRYTEFLEFRSSNPLMAGVTGLIELPLAPSTIFMPGRISALYRGAQAATKSTLGALTDIPREQKLQQAIMPAALQQIAGTDVEGANRLTRVWRDDPTRAAAMLFAGAGETGKLSEETMRVAGERMTWLIANVALDKAAEIEMATRGLDRYSVEGRQLYHVVRNKQIAQIRSAPTAPEGLMVGEALNLDNPAHASWVEETVGRLHGLDLDEVPGTAVAAARKRKKAQETLRTRIAESPEDTIPELLAGQANHAEQRVANWHQLLAGVGEADIANYVARNPETITNLPNHDSFESSMQMLEEWAMASPGETLLRRSPLDTLASEEWVPNQLGEDIAATALPEGYLRRNGRILRQYDSDRPVDMAAGRVGVARMDTLTKQQAHSTLAYMRYLQGRLTSLGRAEELAGSSELFELYGQRIMATQGWQRFGQRRFAKLYKEMKAEAGDQAFALSRKQFEDYGRTIQWVHGQGEDPAIARKFIEKQLAAVTNNETFWTQVGVSKLDPGAQTVDGLAKALEERAPFLAAELDNVPHELRVRLAERGYRPVLMYERISPYDIAGLAGPLAEVNQWKLSARSLGQFASRVDPNDIATLRTRQVRSLLPARLRQVGLELDEPDIDFVLDGLRAKLRRSWEIAQEADDDGAALSRKVALRASGQLNPRSIYDLSLPEVKDALPLFSDAQARTVVGALRQARAVGPQYRGLAHIEDALVSKSQIHRFLEGMQGTQVADDLEGLSRVKAKLAGTAQRDAGWEGLRQYETAKRVAMGAVGAYLGANTAMNADADGEWVAGAAVLGGAGGALAGGRILKPRAVASVVAAQVAAQQYDGDNGDAGLAGLAAGGAVFFGGAKLATKALAGLDGRGWAQYSRLGDGYQKMRDSLRFSLSPIFDIQRYSEGLLLGQIREGTSGVKATLNPAKYAAENLGYGDVKSVRSAYRQAMKGWNGGVADVAEIMEETGGAYFAERGIFGFSSLDWEAGIWAQLLANGVDAQDAVQRARSVFSYGVTGRSALEQSVNFVFFPFSFQKKFLTDVGKFMADDLSRTVVLHNALKMYETLTEEFDLLREWQDWLPTLRQLRDVNPVAYGLSPGRFGGINAPLIELVMDSKLTRAPIDPILNAFLPQALNISTPEEAVNLTSFANQTAAVVRDARQLWRDLGEQGHVLFSDEMVTSSAERTRGWQAFQQLRGDLSGALQARGMDWNAVTRAQPGDALYPMRVRYVQDLRNLRDRMPAWAKSYDDAAANRQERTAELSRMTIAPNGAAEVQMAAFAREVDEISEAVQALYGVNLLEDPTLVPPEVQASLRRIAGRYARGSAQFHRLYRTFFENDLGPLFEEVN